MHTMISRSDCACTRMCQIILVCYFHISPVYAAFNINRNQEQALLAVLYGRFELTQLGRPLLKIKSFSDINMLPRLRCIVYTSNGFGLYTENNNVIFLNYLPAVFPDLPRISLQIILQLAQSIYGYACYQIKGDKNLRCELETRWPSSQPVLQRFLCIPRLLSSLLPDFQWLTQVELVEL